MLLFLTYWFSWYEELINLLTDVLQDRYNKKFNKTACKKFVVDSFYNRVPGLTASTSWLVFSLEFTENL